MKKIVIAVCIVGLASCKIDIDREYVIKSLWLHDSGFSITGHDFLRLEGGFDSAYCRLNNDTIFVRGVPKAKIISFEYENMDMYVQSITSDSVGLYLNMAQFER